MQRKRFNQSVKEAKEFAIGLFWVVVILVLIAKCAT